jgi:LacI family transcriptional regulator
MIALTCMEWCVEEQRCERVVGLDQVRMSRLRTRRGGGAVTIRDVAAAAGVSTMTVSRVINGDRAVRDATRAAVRAAMATLDYVPNPAAQRLAGADRLRIGLLYGNPSASYLGEFLLGTLDEVSRSNVGLVVARCEGEADALRAVQRLLADRVAGIVLTPPLGDFAAVVTLLAASGVPTIAVGTDRPRAPISVVRIDDAAAAAAMTAYLIELGHRRIGFITGDDTASVSADRRDGYLAALAAAGVVPDVTIIAAGSFTYRSGRDAADGLLALAAPPTAIFASNDDMAAGAIAAAHRHGLDVPRDVSIVGFDDTPIGAAIWPALTTINQPIAAMSRVAVERLVAEIRGSRLGSPLSPCRLSLDFSLVRRDSAAAPRA